MKFPRLWLLALAIIALPFTGCTGGGYRPGGVTVAITGVKPAGAAGFEDGAVVTLRYANESIAPLGFSSAKHKLYFNGTLVGSTLSEKPFGIPPMADATQTVTLHLDNAALVRQLAAGDAPVKCRIESVLYQTIDEEKYDQKVVGEGFVDLHSPPATAK